MPTSTCTQDPIENRSEQLPRRDKGELLLHGLLSACGGISGIYGTIFCGHVFANAQTGNLLLLCHALFTQNWIGLLAHMVAAALFVLGIYASVRLPRRLLGGDLLRWKRWCLGIETVCLLVQALLPISWLDKLPGAAYLWPVFFSSALQYNSFGKMDGVAMSTLFSTNNLRQAVLHFAAWRETGDPQEQRKFHSYCWILVSFMAGAVVGLAVAGAWGMQAAILLCAAITAGCGLALCLCRNEGEK